MAPSFTARQGEYLAFIHRFTAKFGVAPSFGEIAAHFGTSSPSVNGMIKTLDRRGLLSREPGVARSLRVLVPASLLPEGDFGSRARRAPKARPSGGAAVPLDDATVAAATAILDVLMPRLAAGENSSRLVLEASEAVRVSLARVGLDSEQTQRIVALVTAEAARWQPGGRGVYVRRRRWGRR